ncbi:MAG: exo-alpha-sialidase [Planctomycetes bacterium]|nr:exo-alpha-sialidase [Planctomycetota bacterium]
MSKELLVATRKGLFVLRRKGRRWKIEEPAFRGVPTSICLRDPRDGALYAALDHGHFGVKLHRQRGEQWEPLGVPSYPQLPEGRVETDRMGRPLPRKLRLIWSLEIDPRAENALWCGTIPGGLFHSADGGKSWQLVESLWNAPERAEWFGGGYDAPGIHSVLVDPRDAMRLVVGVSCGGVWRSDDGGASWRNIAQGMRAEFAPEEQQFNPNIQDPHRLAQCAARPARIWAQHHNGIFRTQKDGTTWKEMKAKAPSRFGFAVAAHPSDPDTAWFAPAQKDECRVPVDGKVLVLRTRDGGKSFEVLKKGLPQEHAYDLIYRHGLEVAADGETLAMGSTTGSLWWSDDAGDSWRTISEHLPPIFAVRFVN